jgi:hypothetical protein
MPDYCCESLHVPAIRRRRYRIGPCRHYPGSYPAQRPSATADARARGVTDGVTGLTSLSMTRQVHRRGRTARLEQRPIGRRFGECSDAL